MPQMNVQGQSLPTTAPEPLTIKSLIELREHAAKNNGRIREQIGNLVSLVGNLHGEITEAPKFDQEEDCKSSGALGHIQFELVEQDRLLTLLDETISRI